MDVSNFLTPGASQETITAAETGSGSVAQNAFQAEYNAVGIKTTSIGLAPSLNGNNVGVPSVVGSSDPQAQAGSVTPATTITNSTSVGYNSGKGYWFGLDSDGKFKFFVGNSAGTRFLFDGTTIDFNGSASVTAINIPDTTTANSFHVDSSGNTWWGANVSSGLSAANASVTSAGAAVFKSISVGGTTTQYTINNSGIFSFGDGSDSAATFDGSATPAGSTKSGNDYTLTRDVYYTNMTVSTGCTVNPAGYRIFGTGTLTLNGTAKIFRDGTAGNDGAPGATGGTAPLGGASVSLADGYVKGSAATGAGGNGGSNSGGTNVGKNGNNGTATTNSLGSNGSTAGNSGAGGGPSGGGAGTAGSGGSSTASNVKLIANWHLATLLDVGSTGATVKFDNSGAAGGGAGGGAGDPASGTQGTGGGGGGGGASGGIVYISFHSIVIGASASITANGGKGGNGGNGGTGTGAGSYGGGGGGGGAGGNGGIIILVYNSLTNSGSISVSAGTKGTKGALGTGVAGNGAAGVDGNDGSAGTIKQFMISL